MSYLIARSIDINTEMQKSCTRKEIINKDYTLDYIIIPWFIR
jgi:hypothetical protein